MQPQPSADDPDAADVKVLAQVLVMAVEAAAACFEPAASEPPPKRQRCEDGVAAAHGSSPGPAASEERVPGVLAAARLQLSAVQQTASPERGSPVTTAASTAVALPRAASAGASPSPPDGGQAEQASSPPAVGGPALRPPSFPQQHPQQLLRQQPMSQQAQQVQAQQVQAQQVPNQQPQQAQVQPQPQLIVGPLPRPYVRPTPAFVLGPAGLRLPQPPHQQPLPPQQQRPVQAVQPVQPVATAALAPASQQPCLPSTGPGPSQLPASLMAFPPLPVQLVAQHHTAAAAVAAAHAVQLPATPLPLPLPPQVPLSQQPGLPCEQPGRRCEFCGLSSGRPTWQQHPATGQWLCTPCGAVLAYLDEAGPPPQQLPALQPEQPSTGGSGPPSEAVDGAAPAVSPAAAAAAAAAAEAENGQPEDGSSGQPVLCSNCGVDRPDPDRPNYRWRKYAPTGEPLCGECWRYQRRHFSCLPEVPQQAGQGASGAAEAPQQQQQQATASAADLVASAQQSPPQAQLEQQQPGVSAAPAADAAAAGPPLPTGSQAGTQSLAAGSGQGVAAGGSSQAGGGGSSQAAGGGGGGGGGGALQRLLRRCLLRPTHRPGAGGAAPAGQQIQQQQQQQQQRQGAAGGTQAPAPGAAQPAAGAAASQRAGGPLERPAQLAAQQPQQVAQDEEPTADGAAGSMAWEAAGGAADGSQPAHCTEAAQPEGGLEQIRPQIELLFPLYRRLAASKAALDREALASGTAGDGSGGAQGASLQLPSETAVAEEGEGQRRQQLEQKRAAMQARLDKLQGQAAMAEQQAADAVVLQREPAEQQPGVSLPPGAQDVSGHRLTPAQLQRQQWPQQPPPPQEQQRQAAQQRRCLACGSTTPGPYKRANWCRHPVTRQEWVCHPCYAKAYSNHKKEQAQQKKLREQEQAQQAQQAQRCEQERAQQAQQAQQREQERARQAQQAQEAASPQLAAVLQPAVKQEQQPLSGPAAELPPLPALSEPAAQQELPSLLYEATGVASAAAAGLDGQLVASFLALLATRPPQEQAAKEGHLLRALARQAYSGAVGLMTTALRLWAPPDS